jgi:hypothetical protein
VGDDQVPLATDDAASTGLSDRVARLEQRLAELRLEVRTDRLVVVDPAQQERLVVGGVLELRIDLPPARMGRRTALLGFSAPSRGHLSGGIGLQLWAGGELVTELCWWEDGEAPG